MVAPVLDWMSPHSCLAALRLSGLTIPIGPCWLPRIAPSNCHDQGRDENQKQEKQRVSAPVGATFTFNPNAKESLNPDILKEDRTHPQFCWWNVQGFKLILQYTIIH